MKKSVKNIPAATKDQVQEAIDAFNRMRMETPRITCKEVWSRCGYALHETIETYFRRQNKMTLNMYHTIMNVAAEYDKKQMSLSLPTITKETAPATQPAALPVADENELILVPKALIQNLLRQAIRQETVDVSPFVEYL